MKRVCSNEILRRMDCIPTKLVTASWRHLPQLPSKKLIPPNPSCPHPPVHVYNVFEFSTAAAFGHTLAATAVETVPGRGRPRHTFPEGAGGNACASRAS